jgi:hypothetical protein
MKVLGSTARTALPSPETGKSARVTAIPEEIITYCA